MIEESFFESLVELNKLDIYRNKKLDDVLDETIIQFDEFESKDIIKIIEMSFLTQTINRIFDNTYEIIKYFEENTLQKRKLLNLKNDCKKHLTPIINDLEKTQILAKAKGNKIEVEYLKNAIYIHKGFLINPNGIMLLFKKIQITLMKYKKLVNKADTYKPKNQKELKIKQTLLLYKQIFEISKFYNGYEIITKGYQKKLWNSTAIKVFKICKLLNHNINDSILKEKVENLFLSKNISLALKPSRLKEASLYTFINKKPLWINQKEDKSLIDKSFLNNIQNIEFETKFDNDDNPYKKIFENSSNSLFLIF